MHDFYSFKKSIQNKTNHTFQSPSILKWIWRQCYTDTNPNTSFKRPFIKLEVSALDFPHTHSDPAWHNYSKQRVSSIFISQGSLIFLPVLIFQNTPTKYYINLCLALWTASIPDAVSEYVYLSYRISQITYLHEWAAGCLSLTTLVFLLLAELSRLASSKFALFHNVNPKTEPLTSAIRRNWGK